MLDKRKQIYGLLISLFSLLFLSGCVTFLQEVTILEDGSGLLGFTIGVETSMYPQFQEQVPEGFELENLLSSLISDENVTNVTRDQYESGGRTYDSFVLEMSDFAAVFDEDRRIGPLTISLDVDDGVYDFRQTINVANSNLRVPGVNLLDLTSIAYSVRLTTPQILSTDGAQEAAGVSVWSVPLSELLQGGQTIRLSSQFILEPYQGTFIPWALLFPYIVTGFLALGGIAILVVVIVNTTGQREKEEKLQF